MRIKFSLAGFLLFALVFTLPLVTVSIVSAPSAYAALNGVVVKGNQRVERSTILSYLQFGPNEPATSEKIDASIKALFQTGLFADVRIDHQGGNLVVNVVENPLINVVNFEGNEEIDDKALQSEVEVHQNMIYTKARVQSDTRRVIALYQSKG